MLQLVILSANKLGQILDGSLVLKIVHPKLSNREDSFIRWFIRQVWNVIPSVEPSAVSSDSSWSKYTQGERLPAKTYSTLYPKDHKRSGGVKPSGLSSQALYFFLQQNGIFFSKTAVSKTAVTCSFLFDMQNLKWNQL